MLKATEEKEEQEFWGGTGAFYSQREKNSNRLSVVAAFTTRGIGRIWWEKNSAFSAPSTLRLSAPPLLRPPVLLPKSYIEQCKCVSSDHDDEGR